MNCTVIIPIGPGHMELGQVAMASVVAAIEADKGAFEEIFVVCGDDTKGEIGRSAARNRMVAQHEQWMGVFGENPTPEKAFETEWLFFLDADDLMCSPKVFGESAFSVVAPYLEKHDCIWGTIFEIDKEGAITKRTQRERDLHNALSRLGMVVRNYPHHGGWCFDCESGSIEHEINLDYYSALTTVQP